MESLGFQVWLIIGNHTFVVLAVEVPAVVVGVVGMGHVPGIEQNWEKELNIHEIMRYACSISLII